MHAGEGNEGMNRRTFLKAGLVGATSALVGRSAIADAARYYASSDPSAFPPPVYRTLGRTGLKITVVGFGAMLTTEPEVMRIAFDQGINYVNTARIYMRGKNEEILGKALKGIRDRVYVATNVHPASSLKKDIVRDVEASLKALETDYIDLIQLQNADQERMSIPETREALVDLKKQGKVRFFGVTTHKNQAAVLNVLVDDRDRFFDTALVAYNFNSDKDIGEAIDRAAKAGIGVIAMKTQAGGYSPEALGSISPHQAALKWVLQNPNVTTAIPSMKDLAQVKEDISVMGMPFRNADGNILRRYGAAVRTDYCGLCGKCEGTCPKGVEISTINRSLMYAEGYKDRELALSTYRGIPSSVSAFACLDCSECVARCVNGLRIPAKMERARNLLA
jgi:uncharacterized protein